MLNDEIMKMMILLIKEVKREMLKKRNEKKVGVRKKEKDERRD